MEALFCEVIGCGRAAAWVLPVPFDLSEDQLCEDHYQELQAHTPEVAARYESLTATHPSEPKRRRSPQSHEPDRCAGTS